MKELLNRKKSIEDKLEECKTYPGMLLPLLFKASAQKEYDTLISKINEKN